MIDVMDNPNYNDNRRYDYSTSGFYERQEFLIICSWINDGAEVIDLGCGNGSLMKFLSDKKKINIEGIEISSSGVENCLKNGLKAKLGEIDKHETYSNYCDNQFDFAVCNVTLQMVIYPEVLLAEMKRIAKFQIISFPNFAYIGNRFDLLFSGKMPKPMLYGYQWYNTGHIHQLSIKDFVDYCEKEKIKILQQKHLGCFKFIANILLPNLFSKVGVYLCQKY